MLLTKTKQKHHQQQKFIEWYVKKKKGKSGNPHTAGLHQNQQGPVCFFWK